VGDSWSIPGYQDVNFDPDITRLQPGMDRCLPLPRETVHMSMPTPGCYLVAGSAVVFIWPRCAVPRRSGGASRNDRGRGTSGPVPSPRGPS
jgi:hypothetical protein